MNDDCGDEVMMRDGSDADEREMNVGHVGGGVGVGVPRSVAQDPVVKRGEKERSQQNQMAICMIIIVCFFLYTGTCTCVSKHQTHRKRKRQLFDVARRQPSSPSTQRL